MDIRPAGPADAETLDEICLRTGAVGEDATELHDDPRLLGDAWVGPYLAFEPGLAFVAVDGADDAVVGYVLGARDTRAFERRCDRDWWPDLRRRHPLDDTGGSAADRAVVRVFHEPPRIHPELAASHPAHLHVDLLPRAQGHGLGRRLVQRLLDELAGLGVEAVHLGVARANTSAIGFYERLGFVVLLTHPDSLVLGRPTTLA